MTNCLGILRRLVTAGLPLLLLACASPPPQAPIGTLLHDGFFAPQDLSAPTQDIFAMSPEMRSFADRELSGFGSGRDLRRRLVEALYDGQRLRLQYDASHTGNASETFQARAGNCLSLVIMTATFARHFGMPVTFRAMDLAPEYSRAGGLTLENGHVNLVLEPASLRATWDASELVVDFLPSQELRGRRYQALDENAVEAMFMNNRAAEALAKGDEDLAYAWVRQALLKDPSFGAAANTLGVLYLRRGHLAAAEAALRHALGGNADSTAALTNLAAVLRRSGREGEASELTARLRRLQPYAPFHFLDLGRQALARGDAVAALGLLQRELERQPHQPEVHFWTAQAYVTIGDKTRATEHLRQAVENSGTRDSQQVYSAKLNHLRALQMQ